MVLGMVEGKETIRLVVGGRVEGFSLGVERAQVHGGDKGGGERGVGCSVYIATFYYSIAPEEAAARGSPVTGHRSLLRV